MGLAIRPSLAHATQLAMQSLASPAHCVRCRSVHQSSGFWRRHSGTATCTSTTFKTSTHGQSCRSASRINAIAVPALRPILPPQDYVRSRLLQFIKRFGVSLGQLLPGFTPAVLDRAVHDTLRALPLPDYGQVGRQKAVGRPATEACTVCCLACTPARPWG